MKKGTRVHYCGTVGTVQANIDYNSDWVTVRWDSGSEEAFDVSLLKPLTPEEEATLTGH